MHDDRITLGVPKGRLLKSVTEKFDSIGIDISIAPEDARAVIVPTSEPNLQLCPIRSKDVSVLLEAGTLDFAIVGSDTLDEFSSLSFGQRTNLDLCKCRMSLIGLPGTIMDPRLYKNCKVATKYPQAARRYFARYGIQPEIVMLHGSVELAVMRGLAHFVVDIVSSGATLRRNNLAELDVINEVSAHSLVSHRTMGDRRRRCVSYIERLCATEVSLMSSHLICTSPTLQ